MDPLSLIERWKVEGRSLAELARLCEVRPQYLNDVRAARHRLHGTAAKLMASVFRREGLIGDTDFAELEFQLACRNMPLSPTAA